MNPLRLSALLCCACLASCRTSRPTVYIEIQNQLPVSVRPGKPLNVKVTGKGQFCVITVNGLEACKTSMPGNEAESGEFAATLGMASLERGNHNGPAWGGRAGSLLELRQDDRCYFLFLDRGVEVLPDGRVHAFRVLNPGVLKGAVGMEERLFAEMLRKLQNSPKKRHSEIAGKYFEKSYAAAPVIGLKAPDAPR